MQWSRSTITRDTVLLASNDQLVEMLNSLAGGPGCMDRGINESHYSALRLVQGEIRRRADVARAATPQEAQ